MGKGAIMRKKTIFEYLVIFFSMQPTWRLAEHLVSC
jgi:hypothetical protein